MNNNKNFIMCPSIEITGKKQTLQTHKGYFEITQNRIQYRYADTKTDFLILHPKQAYGTINDLPPYFTTNTMNIHYSIWRDLSEICFYADNKPSEDLFLDFLFGLKFPFSMKNYDSWFYKMRNLPSNIYEQLYNSSVSLEDKMTTTIETFNENVYIPFKQRSISTLSSSSEGKESKSVKALNFVSKDFPQFLGLQNNLITILRDQARQTSEHQQLSYSVISPILRKMRMLTIFRKNLKMKVLKNQLLLEVEPFPIDTSVILRKINEALK